MIPAAFDYQRAASVDEALRLLEAGGEARLLAGGHSLLPAMKLRLDSPARLIDIAHLAELQYIEESGRHLAIGAATTHYALESSELLKEKAPMLARAASLIGDPQVRNAGTIGGSLAHADPAADYPAPLLASGAEIRVRGPGGERTIRAEEYFVDLFLTSLQAGEILLEVRLPVQEAHTGSAYAKFPHPASRFAVVGCAASLRVEGGTCREARVAFTGLANAAFRDAGVEEALRGRELNEPTLAAAAARAAAGVELLSDRFAGESYRRHLARVYARRALQAARAAANGEAG